MSDGQAVIAEALLCWKKAQGAASAGYGGAQVNCAESTLNAKARRKFGFTHCCSLASAYEGFSRYG